MTIYYFSATGNSLAVAKKIIQHFDNGKLISIPSVLNKKCAFQKDDVVGFVFPVHAWGVPTIVEDFLKLIKCLQAKYIFAVVTCAGTPGATLAQFDAQLKINRDFLHAGFVVREASFSPLKQVPVEKFVIWLNRHHKALSWEKKEKDIMSTITNQEKNIFEHGAFLSAFLGTHLLHKMVIKELHKYSTDFYVTDMCVSCHICEKVCPRQNISIIDGKPNIGTQCELCFACLNWCSKGAIKIKNSDINVLRAHNESIQLMDMIHEPRK